MIVKFCSLSRIVHIQLTALSKTARTVEFDKETIVELNKDNELVGIEMIKPKRRTLMRIAKEYERADLARVDLESLKKAID